jgi:hypothetical protein
MTISVTELVALGNGATIINAGHHAGKREIRGAVRYLPHDLLEPDHLALPVNHKRTVVLYGVGGPTDELRKIAAKMSGDGFTDVRVLEASVADFEAAGGPTQEPSTEQVVPPSRPSEVNDLDRRV